MARKTRSFDSNDNSQAIEDMSVEHTLSMTDGARGLHSVNHGAGIGAHGGRMMSDGMPSPGNANAALQISDPRLSTPVSPRGAALMDDTTTMNDETQGDATMGLGLNDNHHGGMMGDDDERDEMVDVNELGMNEDGDGMYNEKNQNGYDNSDMEDYDFMVGDVLCWFKPSKVQGLKDFCSRTKDWLILNKEQIMSSITVGINQIPEVTSSALLAGLSPILALQSTWMANILISLIGGSPGMISGTTGYIGLALLQVVQQHGVPYVFWVVLFAGILQIVFGLLGLGAIMRLVPNPLMVGFKNGMGFLLIVSQFRYVRHYDIAPSPTRHLLQVGHSWDHFVSTGSDWLDAKSFGTWGIETSVSFLICLLLPRATRIIPSTFVALVVTSGIEWAIMRQFNWSSPTVGDYVDITGPFPGPVFLDYEMPPLNLDTVQKIYLNVLAVFGVSLMESLLTLNVVGELNEVNGLQNRVAFGQGLSNVVSSVLGGMGSAGMVGQSVIANKADGITWLSTFLTGVVVMLIMTCAHPLMNYLPLSAFSGIMFYAAHNLIEYRSLLIGIAAIFPEQLRDRLRVDYKIHRIEVFIMLLVTTLILVFDLSIAVCAGVLISVFAFVWDSSARVVVVREPSDDGESVTYHVSGPLFFATAQSFLEIFPIEEIEMDPEDVIIMLEGTEVHDSSGMFVLKKLHDRFVAMGKTVALSSLSPTSRRLMEKFASTWEGVSFLEVEEIEDEEDVEMRGGVGQEETGI